MKPHTAILDHFALFLYVRPDTKVKLNLIMVIRIELVFFPFFYHHPFIAEEGSCFDRFVMTEFYAL